MHADNEFNYFWSIRDMLCAYITVIATVILILSLPTITIKKKVNCRLNIILSKK